MFMYWINTVRRLLESSVEASHWFLGLLIIDTELLKATLISCPTERMRHAYAQLVVAALQCLAPEEQPHYNQTMKLLRDGPNVTDPPPSYCIWFMEKLFSLLKTARRKNCDQFFFVFSEFAKISVRERQYLVKRDAFQTFTEFSKAVRSFLPLLLLVNPMMMMTMMMMMNLLIMSSQLTERSILAASHYNPQQLKNMLEVRYFFEFSICRLKNES